MYFEEEEKNLLIVGFFAMIIVTFALLFYVITYQSIELKSVDCNYLSPDKKYKIEEYKEFDLTKCGNATIIRNSREKEHCILKQCFEVVK